MNTVQDIQRQLLRHTVATLAYRGGKAVRNAPATFTSFRVAPGTRSARARRLGLRIRFGHRAFFRTISSYCLSHLPWLSIALPGSMYLTCTPASREGSFLLVTV